MSSRITAKQYEELRDQERSPVLREEYERLRIRAQKREELLSSISEKTRQTMLLRKRQQDSLRELRKVFAECYEVTAWMSRDRRPSLAYDAQNSLYPKLRGIRERLARARREAAEGCSLQAEWLADHAELIAEVESFKSS